MEYSKSKLAIRIGYSIKSLSVLIGGYEYMADKKNAAFLVFIIGAVANETVNIISYMQQNTKAKKKEIKNE